jgi:WD40 repeat protein
VPGALASLPYSAIPSGLAWSPSGSALAVASDDATIRLFGPDPGHGSLGQPRVVKETECIYDFSWCGASGRLAATGRYQPVHLWDTGEGEEGLQPTIAATYKCINQLDELSHAFSVAMAGDGETLYCGLRGEVRQFCVERPGRESTVLRLDPGQAAIVSCLALHPALPVLAAGCYNRTSGLYTTSGQLLCLLAGQRGGVTQLAFSPDGTRLFTGGRKDHEILCWDLRRPGQLLCALHREAATNQRVQFCLSPCGSHLASACTDGSVRVWDLARPADPETGVLAPSSAWLLHGDAVTGLGWHPGGRVIASCSGQRHFTSEDDEAEEEERSVRLWSLAS